MKEPTLTIKEDQKYGEPIRIVKLDSGDQLRLFQSGDNYSLIFYYKGSPTLLQESTNKLNLTSKDIKKIRKELKL